MVSLPVGDSLTSLDQVLSILQVVFQVLLEPSFAEQESESSLQKLTKLPDLLLHNQVQSSMDMLWFTESTKTRSGISSEFMSLLSPTSLSSKIKKFLLIPHNKLSWVLLSFGSDGCSSMPVHLLLFLEDLT